MSFFLSSVLSSVLPRANINYGKCKDPTISYNDNMGYFPANRAQFDHEPTKEIGPIYDFICSQLENKCAAPDITLDYCKIAIKQANMAGWSKKARAEAFNNYMLYLKTINDPMPDVTPAGKPKPTPTPSGLPKKGLNISTVFSAEAVEFDGWVDPVWWINDKLVGTKGTPSQCQLKPNGYKMPGGHYLIPDCEGHDTNSIPLMRKALIEIINATIKNETLKDEERVFKYGTRSERICSDARRSLPRSSSNNVTLALNQTTLPELKPDEPEWSPDEDNRTGYCYISKRKYTRWPVEMKLIIGDYADGKGFGQGHFHYTITKPTGNACKLCSFFAVGGAGSAAVGSAASALSTVAKPLVGPGFGFAGAFITLQCLVNCG
ncbi:hypothetical protein BKA66DRAFT_576373 [Pyrenochaeta sp. MPI-SDFR-AT-0127]|nr:hypothetical protein BKA66DRAFT_576373 [Pyrenochaeta sp. MPI-SDFR-AT-0127]